MARGVEGYHVSMVDAFASNSGRRYRIGAVLFNAETGEVVNAQPDAEPLTARLAPKPTQLLCMLIDCNGALLTTEAIRDALWPDVQVEFDQGMHYCMRQVRAALGDSASSPQYIETLPRRGYRLLVPAELLVTKPAEASPTDHRSRKQFVATVAVAALIVVALISAAIAQRKDQQSIRLAIMPFDPPEGSSLVAVADIPTHLLAEFGDDSAFAVIGPSTTSQYMASTSPLTDAASELLVSFIINGRFLVHEDQDKVLVELIRTSDGAHVWVRFYDDSMTADRIAAEVAESVRVHLTSTAEQ